MRAALVLGVAALGCADNLPVAPVPNNANPGATTKGEQEALMKKLADAGYTREKLDALPPEKRLLIAGFTPDEIADHFTARDKDADVLVDPDDATAGTAARGSAGGPKAGGDRNDNGTVRRPMTPEEALRAVDINAVLDESWHAGNRFGKIVPESTVGDLMNTHKVAGGRVVSSQTLSGDIGVQSGTDMKPDRSGGAPTGKEQVAIAGLDYQSSPYVTPDGKHFAPSVEANKVHRLEGTIDDKLENAAEVCMGRAVAAQAQKQSKSLDEIQQTREAARAAKLAAGEPIPPELAPENDPHIAKMLRRDDSADQMPGIMTRDRETQIDPRTGLGYSTTERMDLGVTPNQERTIHWKNAVDMPADAQVTRSDLPGQPVMVQDPSSGRFVTTDKVAAEQADYDRLQRESAQRVADEEARKRAAAMGTV